jgi:hypothetical protein
VRARIGSSTVGAREAAIDSSRTLRAARSFHLVTAAAVLGGIALHASFIGRAMFRIAGQPTFSLFDDAMISMTYARNLAEGHGLVWMAGEAPVEGYTNLLWTLVMALPHLAGMPDRLASLPIQILGVLILAGTSALVAQIARRLAVLPVTPVLAALGVALCFPLVFWTLRGLEVGLVAFFVAAACLLALRLVEAVRRRDVLWLCAALAAAVLTRTDAVAPLVVVLGFLFLHPGAPRRVAWAGGFTLAATLAGHTGLRLIYYGSALPNTYTLKVAGHGLEERLARGFPALFEAVFTTLWAPLLLAFALLLIRRLRLRPAEWLLTGVAASAMAYSVYVGGDVWEFAGFANRFVSVGLPLLFVLALLGSEAVLEALVAARARAPAALAVGLALLFAIHDGPVRDWWTNGGLHVQDDQILVRQGLAIGAATPETARIAVIWAGAIPYFSRRPAIDLLGKSDPVIAGLPPRGAFVPGHDKWDIEYSVGRLAPDLIALGFRLPPRDIERIEELGYEKVAQYYVRRGAPVDPRPLRAPWR